MDYNFKQIEDEAKEFWNKNQVYKVKEDGAREKYYVLDMFPYPSGAGLHVGHPLGYIASDIYSRFKRLKGFNVLHPMGYDSFGLPAEQYAIQTGQHPAITTRQNIETYRRQLDQLGFSFDWSREVQTSDPKFYKWTQWIFIQLFNSWYNNETDKAENIESLIHLFKTKGNQQVKATCDETEIFSADEWNSKTEKQQQDLLMNYRLAYLGDQYVNWCAALGSVLANDEVKDGISERGGYPVERKLMRQWMLRITAYADRLLQGLDELQWSESIKESQRNWIGKSNGCSLEFQLAGSDKKIEVFTTRPDTVFGVTFLTLAPEHELVNEITTDSQKQAIEEYVSYAKSRSERDRMTEVKKITGVFTGAFVVHPFTGKNIPVWIGDYVLAGYGTGAVMAVPGHDQRDWNFANHFGLAKTEVVLGGDISEKAFEENGIGCNSDFLNGLETTEAKKKIISEIELRQLGKGKVNFKLRNAVFGRQRYWGEPIPVYYDEQGIARAIKESELPLVLPEIDKYQPTETGEPPLSHATNWKYNGKFEYEKTTMPGWAGSSWYFLRYMDPKNENEFASVSSMKYWKQIDFYVGGSEHATGHLMYFRFWTKFLFDCGYIFFDEPAKRLVNQGMIQGMSAILYRSEKDSNLFSNQEFENEISFAVHVDVNLLKGDIISLIDFQKSKPEYKTSKFIDDKSELKCERIIEKMSKSKYNVVNPDDMVAQYGADAFRLYEMFLGPIEQSKPWDTKGIDGVARFLRKLWRMFYDEKGNWSVTKTEPNNASLKVLHQTIKKVTDDMEKLSFNTTVAQFMICVNELGALNERSEEVLKSLLILIHPMAPFISEYLWKQTGEKDTILNATFPLFNQKFVVENEFEYPVSVNGKTRTKILLSLNADSIEVEKQVLELEAVQKWLEGKPVKKVIFVKGRMVNVVC